MSTAFSDSFIRNIKTTGRYTDAATQGLNLQVKSNGGRYWAMRYLFRDKRYGEGRSNGELYYHGLKRATHKSPPPQVAV